MKEYTFVARVVGGGKITIPLEVRNLLKIKDGSIVESTVRLMEEGDENIQKSS